MSHGVILVMGVSGSGKSTIASMLAGALDCEFADADWFHPQANIEKMAGGHPLEDADRAPWLDAIHAWIAERAHRPGCGVIACSALKRAYRDRLRADDAGFRLVYLHGSRDLIAARIVAREGHFMRAEMLEGQFRDLQEPEPDEAAVTVSIEPPPNEIVQRILDAIGAAPARPAGAGR